MPLPRKKWHSIDDAAKELNIFPNDVEHYLERGNLHAVLRVVDLFATCSNMGDDPFIKSEDTDVQCRDGLFEVHDYHRIRWSKSEKGNEYDSFDLLGVAGRLFEIDEPDNTKAKFYPSNKTVCRSDLLITDKEITAVTIDSTGR
jgi:hypothetical protein